MLLSKLHLNVTFRRVKIKIHCLLFKTSKTVLLGVQNAEAKAKEDNGNKISVNILDASFLDHPRSRTWGTLSKVVKQPALLIWETIKALEFGKATLSTRPWIIPTGEYHVEEKKKKSQEASYESLTILQAPRRNFGWH